MKNNISIRAHHFDQIKVFSFVRTIRDYQCFKARLLPIVILKRRYINNISYSTYPKRLINHKRTYPKPLYSTTNTYSNVADGGAFFHTTTQHNITQRDEYHDNRKTLC